MPSSATLYAGLVASAAFSAVALAPTALALPAPTRAHADASAGTRTDESPGIDDTATLLSGRIVSSGGAARVSFDLTCPRGDRWTASMVVLLEGAGAPDDITAGTTSPPPSGRCTGRPHRVTLTLHAAPVQQWDHSTDPPTLLSEVLPPLPRTCSAEYGVSFEGTGWSIAFDRGGADGGPDGPGPRLCLR